MELSHRSTCNSYSILLYYYHYYFPPPCCLCTSTYTAIHSFVSIHCPLPRSRLESSHQSIASPRLDSTLNTNNTTNMTSSTTENPAVVCVLYVHLTYTPFPLTNHYSSCGSVAGNDPQHMETARALAHEFHANNVQLVYGGGTSGLMGEIARTLVSLSGPDAVHGVIPRALVRTEPGLQDDTSGTSTPTSNGSTMDGGKKHERTLSVNGSVETSKLLQESVYGRTTIVPDMHTRKRLMARKVLEGGPGSGFVTLAGGFGTIEEVMEMTTWNQLGIHKVGIVLLNVNGYWDGLLAWVRNAVATGYIGPENGKILVEAKDVKEVWPKLVEYKVSQGRMQLNWGEE